MICWTFSHFFPTSCALVPLVDLLLRPASRTSSQLTTPPPTDTVIPEAKSAPFPQVVPEFSRELASVKPESFQGAKKIVGYTSKTPQLLKESLPHAPTADTRLLSNERMEFLGDAILDLIICEALY